MDPTLARLRPSALIRQFSSNRRHRKIPTQQKTNRELQKRAFVPRRLFNVKPKLKTTSASRHQMLAPNAVVGNWQWQPQLLTARRSGNIERLGWIKIALMPKSCVRQRARLPLLNRGERCGNHTAIDRIE